MRKKGGVPIEIISRLLTTGAYRDEALVGKIFKCARERGKNRKK